MLCQYSNIAGIPGQGFHFHVFGIAIMDVLGTILGAWIISKWFSLHLGYTILGMFILGIIVHKLFCVKSTLNTLLHL
jgi:hypothetical protein